MTLEELQETWERLADVVETGEFLQFERITPAPEIKAPDLVAFNLLYSILPPKFGDIVAGAAHDEIYLYPDLEELAEVITEEQILTLIRCGVRLDSSTDSLAMFV